MGAEKLISFLGFAGFRLAALLAILILGVVAARRHRLPGLWVLVGAAALMALHGLVFVLISSPISLMEHDSIRTFAGLMGYIYYATLIVALSGWGLMAFGGTSGPATNAELGAAPNGGPATRLGHSGVTEEPPSAS